MCVHVCMLHFQRSCWISEDETVVVIIQINHYNSTESCDPHFFFSFFWVFFNCSLACWKELELHLEIKVVFLHLYLSCRRKLSPPSFPYEQTATNFFLHSKHKLTTLHSPDHIPKVISLNDQFQPFTNISVVSIQQDTLAFFLLP